MSALAPRVVVVHRRTELTELVAEHGTRGQVAFHLASRGRDLAELEAADAAVTAALAAVGAAIGPDLRRGAVERADLPRFLFDPEDVVVVVGQDGLVANVAQYLDGQPVLGVDPEPGRNPGVLVRHTPQEVAGLLAVLLDPARRARAGERRTLVRARTDDGQTHLALNELYLGHRGHQTARYRITGAGEAERQASSGILVGTGTGATGWCGSVHAERHSDLALPAPEEPALAWFVREAWASPATGTTRTQGRIEAGEALTVQVETDGLVLFGDGIEADRITLRWGQEVRFTVADTSLLLI